MLPAVQQARAALHVLLVLLPWLRKTLLRRVVLRMAVRHLGLLAVWSFSIQLLLAVPRVGLRLWGDGRELWARPMSALALL